MSCLVDNSGRPALSERKQRSRSGEDGRWEIGGETRKGGRGKLQSVYILYEVRIKETELFFNSE